MTKNDNGEINIKSDGIDTKTPVVYNNKEPLILYGSAILGYFTVGLGFIAALIFAYIVKGGSDVLTKSLCRYYIRTFWFCILWLIIFVALVLFAIGIPLLIGLSIWFLYRIIKGGYYSWKGLDPYPVKA